MTDITSAILAERRARCLRASGSPPSTRRRSGAPPTRLRCTNWRSRSACRRRRLMSSGPRARVSAPRTLTFPCVIKPARSRLKTPAGWIKTAVRSVGSGDDYARLLATAPELRYPFMIQRQIEGDGVGVFALCDRGETRMLFSHRRLREKPPWGGVSVLRESIAVDPVAADYRRRLLRALGWHGVAMVEFKRERATGVPFLMEINGRFWGSLQLAIDAGLDFPREPRAPLSRRRGAGAARISRRDSIAMAARRSRSPADADERPGPAPPGSPALSELCLDFCRFFRRDTHYEVESVSDPGPALHELRSYVRALFKPAGA